ncbi:MAG: dihydrolipoyllysine-residue acetyltransferase [Proteobacteria bacterium]|nr:dihydrolipoyllysine-residue acetyltransferase [Pseudomonadota bacterium]
MTTLKEVSVPDIGNYTDVEVIEVAVKPGAKVKAEDSLITLETEKASMEVPSPYTGTVKEMKIKVGDKVSQGTLIALIESEVQADQQESTQPAESENASKQAPLVQDELMTIKVPDTGAAKQVEIIEISVKPGDVIQAEDTLITLESEKASMDIPSPHAGKVETVLVKVGDKVNEGDAIVTMTVSAQKEGKVQQESPQASSSALPSQTQVSKTITKPLKDFSQVHAGPATRRLARELGVDLTVVQGTGHRNRVTLKDVQEYVKGVMQNAQSGAFVEKAPEIDFSQFGDIEVKPLSRIKKWTAKNLSRNWLTIPHVTQFEEADVTELEIFRQENQEAAIAQGTKLTPLPFIIMACISALKTYPQFNASLAANGSDIILKQYFHIGVAVDTPNGLMVPVIKHADKKSLYDIAKELGELSALAKEGKIKAEQMQGSSFTISSLGGIGGTAFTPIINAPDLAILGVSKVQIKPQYVHDQFIPRKMLPLSLSYDHRVIDGVEGARFAAHIAAQLQDIRKLLL